MNKKAIKEINKFVHLHYLDEVPALSNDVAEYILKLLENQEKAIPIKKNFINKFHQKDYCYICSECDSLISFNKPFTEIPLNEYVDRCRNSDCNKLLDWSKIK